MAYTYQINDWAYDTDQEEHWETVPAPATDNTGAYWLVREAEQQYPDTTMGRVLDETGTEIARKYFVD